MSKVVSGVVLALSLAAIQVFGAEYHWKTYYSNRTAGEGETNDDRLKLKYNVTDNLYFDILNERVNYDVTRQRYLGGEIKWQILPWLKYEMFDRGVRDIHTESLKFFKTKDMGEYEGLMGFVYHQQNYGLAQPLLYLGLKGEGFEFDYAVNPDQSSTKIIYAKESDCWGMKVVPSIEFRNTMPENRKFLHFKIEASH